jgi:Mn2+/Fe2+ NRAMP family transporter
MTSPPPAPDSPTIAPGARERASIGPGLIFALSVIGAGDFVANTAIGATHGTALLWALLLAAICRFVWVDTSARYVLVTGETPFQGFARIGNWLLWLVLASLIVHRHVHGLYHILLMGASIQLILPLPAPAGATIWSLLFVALGFSLVFWGGYRTLERFFKYLMAFMGATLVAVVAAAPPSPIAVLQGLFVPSIPPTQGAYSTILLLTALLGTEACSISNITYAYFMWQKGWRNLSFASRQRWDLFAGIGAMLAMGVLLQVAAAGALGDARSAPRDVSDLVRIFSDRLGFLGKLAFSLGIWAAVITSYIGGVSGFSLALTDLFRSFVPRFQRPNLSHSREDLRRDPLFARFVIFFAFSPLYILYTHVRPILLVLVASSLVVVVVPVVSLSLLYLTSRPQIMGQHRNHWLTNAILLFISAVSLYFVYRNGAELLARFHS